MNHPWLEGVNWDIIEAKLVANENIPFWPSLGDNFDNTLANKKENMDMEHYEEYLKKINDSGYFKNFYFNYFNIKQSKTLEKTSNSLKNTSNTDGLKTSRSEVENFLNNISMRNVKRNISYIKINTNNLDNNDGQNKEHISTESKVGKQYKIKIKTNTILSNKSRIYEKQQLNKFNRALLFDYNYNIDDNIDNNKNDENNNKDIKIN